MNPTTIIIAGLVLVPTVALVTWAWFAMARVEKELSFITGFEGKDFEIGRQAMKDTERVRWPIPG